MGFVGAVLTPEFCFVLPERPVVVPAGAAGSNPLAVLAGFDLVEDVVTQKLPLLVTVDGGIDETVDADDDLFVPFGVFEA